MTFDEFIGIRYPDPTEPTALIDTAPHHLNPTGQINGAVFMSLADNVATRAANIAYEQKTGERRFCVVVDAHTAMLANQPGGRIRAAAVPVSVGRRIVVIRTEVRGEEDRLLATVTTTHVPT